MVGYLRLPFHALIFSVGGLSFREVAETSMLPTKWRNLWSAWADGSFRCFSASYINRKQIKMQRWTCGLVCWTPVSYVEHLYSNRRSDFWFQLPDNRKHGRQQIMTQTVGPLSSMWETQTKSWVHTYLLAIGGENQWMGAFSLSLFGCASQVNETEIYKHT